MGRPTKKPYNGEPPYKWRVFFDSGKKRISRKFRTKKDAENFLRIKEVEYINLGRKVAVTLDEVLKQQAYEAAEILRPYGRTLTEAAEFLKKHLEATERSARVSDLVLPFLEAKKKEGKSRR
ncbi:MAG: hypothetical protein O7C75_03465, partial [Verrucomicrobia bacterium]|nr:hypothetical protein [Verrucomicrobiota bacterium]